MASRSDLIAELQRPAALPPTSGRAAQAKASAIRQLMRLDGSEELTEAEEHLWDPERDPNSRVDRRDWHPSGDDPTWIELDLCRTVAQRRRWWMNLHAGHGP
ncbi:MAG: hypothetical protein K0R41_300 [Geminicoccaceae bacterium]|jgi:hypothetical protein|nr:hypothetical protein [Geminicoccaceae bacterium]